MSNKLGFKFVCPKCKNTVFLGKVDFDMEDWVECSCGHGDEAWCFPHTIIGIPVFTMGGHYNNDPLNVLTEEEVMKQFFWLLNPDFTVHGCHPYAIGSLEHCIAVFNKAEPEDLPKGSSTTLM